MAALNKQTFDEIVNLLVPHMDTVASRRSFVMQALHDAPTLLQRIRYEGDAHQFTVSLVKTCSQYGQIAAGQSAIAALLTHLREQVGYDRQQSIDQLIAQIGGETRRAGSTPAELRENPALGIEQGENAEQNMVMKILRDPLWQFIAVVAIVIGIVTSGGSGNSTQSAAQPTPSTPRITAQQNMDIRHGPGTSFSRIALLGVGDHLDVLGISDNGRWYQVLLPNGNTGWVVAASSAGEVSGPLGALAVIVATSTSTTTPDIAAAVATLSFEQTSTASSQSVTGIPTTNGTDAAALAETAASWTQTPTPNLRDTAEARLTLTSVATPIPDSDGDGIPSDIDACPTLGDQGYGIDDSGCPIPPPRNVTATVVDNCPPEACPNPPTFTAMPTQVPAIALLETLEYFQSRITPTIQPDANIIGNGQLYPFYDDRVNYPDVMDVELRLILYELIITPTPSGQATVVAANDDIERPRVEQNPSPLETPRPARVEDDLEGVPPFIIAELECSDSVFSGCEAQDVRDVQLRGVNEWLWRVQPIVDQPSRQSLSIVLYAANTDGSKASNTPIYRHNFSVKVGDPFSLRDFAEENTAALLSGITAILTAIGGGIFALMQSKKKSSSTTSADKTSTSETSMDDVSGGSVSIGGTTAYHGNVTINQGIATPQESSDSNKDDNTDTGEDKPKPTAFISYRRSASWEMAHIIRDRLRNAGGDIFLDVHDIHEGRFADIIQKNIDEREFFIVILAPGTLESKWVRREIRHAIDNKKKVVPVLINDFDLYGDEMPDDLSDIADYNAIRIEQMYLDAGINRIALFMGLKKGS